MKRISEKTNMVTLVIDYEDPVKRIYNTFVKDNANKNIWRGYLSMSSDKGYLDGFFGSDCYERITTCELYEKMNECDHYICDTITAFSEDGVVSTRYMEIIEKASLYDPEDSVEEVCGMRLNYINI